VCAITTATAIKAPTIINSADAQPSARRPAVGFGVCDLLARIFCDFAAATECASSETALAFDQGLLN
jgi:hypothetical protein